MRAQVLQPVQCFLQGRGVPSRNPPHRHAGFHRRVEPVAPPFERAGMFVAIHPVGHRFPALPDREVDDAVLAQWPNLGGAAVPIGNQPPDETGRLVRKLMDGVDAVLEIGDVWMIQRLLEPGHIELRESVFHVFPCRDLLFREPTWFVLSWSKGVKIKKVSAGSLD